MHSFGAITSLNSSGRKWGRNRLRDCETLNISWQRSNPDTQTNWFVCDSTMKLAPQLNIAEPLYGFVTVTVCFPIAQSVHWHTDTCIISIFYKYCGRMDTETKWKIIVLISYYAPNLALERVSCGDLNSTHNSNHIVFSSVNLHLFTLSLSTCQAKQLVWPPALSVAGVRLAHTQLMAQHSLQHMTGVSCISPEGLPTACDSSDHLWWSFLALTLPGISVA